MAKLDEKSRTRIGELLKEKIPPHWKVAIGLRGCAFLEVDQDGGRPLSRFPTPDSHVIVVQNGPENHVDADLFVRVDCPPGYAEARQPVGTISHEAGVGWKERMAEDIADVVMEIEAALTGADPGEA
jgi:hypothetical protein